MVDGKQHRYHDAFKCAELLQRPAGAVPELPQCHRNQRIICRTERRRQTTAKRHRHCQANVRSKGKAAFSTAWLPFPHIQKQQHRRGKQRPCRHTAHQIGADLFRLCGTMPQQKPGQQPGTEQKLCHITAGCHCHTAHGIEISFQTGADAPQRQQERHKPHCLRHRCALQELTAQRLGKSENASRHRHREQQTKPHRIPQDLRRTAAGLSQFL